MTDSPRLLPAFIAVLIAGSMSPARAAEIEWALIPDPGNAADETGFGAVPEPFAIGRTEVTVAQYTEFLNAVAASDPGGLWHVGDGVSRTGSDGNYQYSISPGMDNRPIANISFWKAARFANWLHNGKPTGPQSGATTEDGAYTLTPAGIEANTVTRNPGAEYWVPSHDEWYKAAYYDSAQSIYYDYPAGSNSVTSCSTITSAANSANCDDAYFQGVDVASYTGSPSPYGTFDQGGNLEEWTDTIVSGGRVLRGGAFFDDPELYLAADAPSSGASGQTGTNVGFRVAKNLPEPSMAVLVFAGAMALAGMRRRRSQCLAPRTALRPPEKGVRVKPA